MAALGILGTFGVVLWTITMLFRCCNEYVASLQDLLELNAMEKSKSKDYKAVAVRAKNQFEGSAEETSLSPGYR